jgi:hypothetical protein
VTATRAATLRRALVVLGAGALFAVALACGGARPKAAATAPAARSSEDPRAQIEVLDREIANDMARAHLAPPEAALCSGAACAAAMSAPFTTPTATDLQCRPAPTQRCTDLCALSTSICNNQQKICDLAKQMPGDDWAANKCESARASCKAGNDSCCTCLA